MNRNPGNTLSCLDHWEITPLFEDKIVSWLIVIASIYSPLPSKYKKESIKIK